MAVSTRVSLPDASDLLAPGPLVTLREGGMEVTIAPQAGGRIAQIARHGIEQLTGYQPGTSAMIHWGCYPMLPWAGRVRRGVFTFEGKTYQLPVNLAPHSIHGVGFALAWQVQRVDKRSVELALPLPEDARWPFGGSAHQRLVLGEDHLRLELSVTAGAMAMPVTLGWHPWFRKPRRLQFNPTALYPRDHDGIATLPVVPPVPGPWDDCFANNEAVVLDHGSEQVTLRSDCTHWVVYDHLPEATCVEPQSGPPDAFSIEPQSLAPRQTLARWFEMTWATP